MSAESVINEIQNTQSLARQIAQSSIAATTTLVTDAIQKLTRYTPEFPEEPVRLSDSGASDGTAFSPEEKPPNFPTIRTAQDVKMGALGDIDTIDESFDGVRPKIALPDYSYDKVTPLAPFSESAPKIDTGFDMPKEPEISDPEMPELLSLRSDIAVQQLNLPAFKPFLPPRPKYSLTNEFVAQFATGKSALPDANDYGNGLVSRFFPQWQQTINQLSTRINSVLGGAQTALTDTFDGWLYEIARGRIIADSEKAIEEINEQTKATGWDLPGATRAAGIRRITESAQQALQSAALDVYAKRTEREVQHLQYVMGQALPLHQAAIALFAQGFDMSMKAFEAARKYAETATNFVVTVYQTLQHDYELDYQLIDKQIEIVKEERNGELAKLQVTEAELKVESLKSAHNRERLEQLRAEIDIGNQRLERYEKQISALGKLLEGRRLPLEAFRSSIEAYLASQQAKDGEYKQLESLIRGDEAKTKGQLSMLEVYKTDAAVFDTKIGAKAKKIDGQIQRNQQVLKEFEIKQDAEVKLTQIDESVAKHALDAYVAMSHVYIAESDQRLEKNRLDFQKAVENSKIDLANRQFEMDIQFKNLEVEMTLMKATAELQLSAAEVQGRVGAAAMTVMNTMTELSASVSE